jgi:hypothetical protein
MTVTPSRFGVRRSRNRWLRLIWCCLILVFLSVLKSFKALHLPYFTLRTFHISCCSVRWLLERSLHLHRVTSPAHLDSVLRAVSAALALLRPDPVPALTDADAEACSVVSDISPQSPPKSANEAGKEFAVAEQETPGTTIFEEYEGPTAENAETISDSLLRRLAAAVHDGSARPIDTEPFYWGRTNPRRVGPRRLFAVAKPTSLSALISGTGSIEAGGGAAAIVLCDRRNSFDRRDAEAAADLISRWFAAVVGAEEVQGKNNTIPSWDGITTEIGKSSDSAHSKGEAALKRNFPVTKKQNGTVPAKAVAVSLAVSRSGPGMCQLSREQQAAVKAPLGPVLVLAGPGSGKTTVLAHRARYLAALTAAPSSAFLVRSND